MSINIQTTGINHFALRSTDLSRSKQFYAETLGFPLVMDTDAAFVFLAGSTVIGVMAPDAKTPAGDRFSDLRVGVDHFALGCDDDAEIERVASELSGAGIENSGVKTDPATGKSYVAFHDPDGIIWELYRA